MRALLKIAAASGLLFATAAHSFVGVYAYDQASCGMIRDMGMADSMLTIERNGFSGYEWGCSFKQVQDLRQTGFTIIDGDCAAEGMEYKQRYLMTFAVGSNDVFLITQEGKNASYVRRYEYCGQAKDVFKKFR
ncbi:MAG TPA: hypothetical protein DD656_05640 [Alphaproteobacteria bacterium]|nr:hypothetical protein [Alphaproteobacteria bacterium]